MRGHQQPSGQGLAVELQTAGRSVAPAVVVIRGRIVAATASVVTIMVPLVPPPVIPPPVVAAVPVLPIPIVSPAGQSTVWQALSSLRLHAIPHAW